MLLVLAACGEDAQCVIDTDCPTGQYCAEQSCLPIGTATDVGTEDAGADDMEEEEDTSTPDVSEDTESDVSEDVAEDTADDVSEDVSEDTAAADTAANA